MRRAGVGRDSVRLAGEDMTAVGFNACGGHGCMSVTSNGARSLWSAFQAACQAGDFSTALTIQDRRAPWHKARFLEPNPQGVKYAASRLGLCGDEVRLPLVPTAESTRKAIDAALVHAGLVN